MGPSNGALASELTASSLEDEWLWGWDPTPGIVSVWAEPDGRAFVWRRSPTTGVLIREDERFRPWLLLSSLDDVAHLGAALGTDDDARAPFRYRELRGPGALRYLLSAERFDLLAEAILAGVRARTGEPVRQLRDVTDVAMHTLPPEEQYLVATGRTYFRDLPFERLHRMQFDLETTGLDPEHHRVFMIAVRANDGSVELLEADDASPRAEAELITRLAARVQALDPDVIENHNLHGFDVPFLATRARLLRMPLTLGRLGHRALKQRAAQRGARSGSDASRRVRFIAPGRELIDTLDAVRRWDFSARELPSHGLKAVARHLGISGPEREQIRGDQIYATYGTDPARVRRYAAADVEEVAALAARMSGAAFALARMAPRRYERLADAGAATGVIDPLLVRAYVRAGEALPVHGVGDGTVHSGAALHLFATGVAHRVVKADVASLYPSLMRAFRIGPARDHLGALLALVDRLVEQRLDAKARAKAAPPGSAERHTHEATSAAMKLVVNSAYGYLAAGEGLTRFADVHAANEVTRRGRETLLLLCRELAARGVTLLEADTDGVYFAVPAAWSEADERRVVAEVAALLPALVSLEFEGRYAAMLSHEPKNYALRTYDGALILRGVAFRSSRAEPFGETFLRRALEQLLVDDVAGVRRVFLETVTALRTRAYPTVAMASRVRLTKSPARYDATRLARREFAYEAMLASGRAHWRVGDRVRVYRATNGEGRVVEEYDGESVLADGDDARDYDVEYYVQLLRRTFATRLARAFRPADFAAVFADVDQLPLFEPATASITTVLEPRERIA
ncbi:MAG: ribonuclease H-like domain-containing protein [Gemmatimonadaceae bacterium]|nr:ribonuclease H-like domain-containing protein [Gemmatimonadaceae bacterium]